MEPLHALCVSVLSAVFRLERRWGMTPYQLYKQFGVVSRRVVRYCGCKRFFARWCPGGNRTLPTISVAIHGPCSRASHDGSDAGPSHTGP